MQIKKGKCLCHPNTSFYIENKLQTKCVNCSLLKKCKGEVFACQEFYPPPPVFSVPVNSPSQ